MNIQNNNEYTCTFQPDTKYTCGCTPQFLICFEAWAKLAQLWLVCVCHWEYTS